MLAVILLAAVAAPVPKAGLTPERLNGISILYTTDQATGSCAEIVGQDYVTRFSDGQYVDTMKQSGARSDAGTYEYQRLSDTEAQVTFHVMQGGTWGGGDYVDVLQYTTPGGGTYHGHQTDGNCTYSGKFFVQP